MSYVIRGTAAEGSIRFLFADTKDMVERARSIHNTSPVISAALGRTLTISSVMGLMLKGENDILTVRIKCDGPVGGITVTADSKGYVKGYAENTDVDLPLNKFGKLDVYGAVGNGSLSVIKDLGLKEPYVGQVPLISGEIAEDFTYYFTASEQVPSAVSLGVLVDVDLSVKQAGGFVLQLMPDCDEELITRLERRLGAVPSVTSMLEEGMSCEDMAERVLHGFEPVVLDSVEVGYRCSCSREKVSTALMNLGKEELTDILETDKKANVHCKFCNTDYDFDENDIRNMIAALG